MTSRPRHDVRIQAPPAAEGAELHGEFSDWLTPIRFARGEARLSLAAGVYAYKLKIDGVWTLDAGNPRTRGAGEYRNSVLSVGGAAEPLLFAPASPWLSDDGRGGVAVVAALRRGAGERLWVRWSEGEAERRTPMALALEESEHLVFRAALPISSARATIRFELPDGTLVGPEDEPDGVFLHERERSELPSWWERAVVYTILVDRFRPEHDTAAWGADPGPRLPAGGHLEGVRRSLDHLQRLGVDTLYLTPLHLAASCHRYDVVDPLAVDPALGGDEALDRLVTDLHARGMRLLVDFSFSHAGRGFPAYEEILALGPAAPRAGWFRWAGDPPALVHYGSRREAPLFDLDHPEVRALVLRAADHWASRGVDGLRLDSAAEMPVDLARAVRARLRAMRPDALVVGELIPRHAFRWRAEGALDAATDFGFHAVATDFLARGAIDAAEARRRLLEIDLQRGGPDAVQMRFLSTHDHPRFATLAGLSGRGGPELGLLFLLTSPGVPALLYGEELGLSADVAAAPEDVWADRMPMPWSGPAQRDRLLPLVPRLLALRASSPALRGGTCALVHGEGSLLVYRREAEGEVVDVALNGGDATVTFDLEDAALPLVDPLVFVGDAAVDEQTVALGPRAGVVLRRGPRRVGASGWRIELGANAAARDADLRAGAARTLARPTRLDFSVTERCNLRCLHCITDAPERTRTGAARTLSPRLVDRLRDDLAFAAYVGFVHGGEPLAAPVLFDVLAALRAARRGEPCAVHVLTNGVLLGERMVARLVEAGVGSISVSLDGATAATNDAVREGGRLAAIVENLRGAVRLRRALGADLRLGVSCVVMAGNVAELSALVDLAAAAGVDWIKLEELVPVNAFAERSLVRLDAGPAREAVARALERARAAGLVAVDHTDAPVVWRCRLDAEPATARFLAADEFANRSEIHPCRAAWEHACISPNGAVQLGDFFGPVLGNLAEKTLVDLWNGPVAQAERRRAQQGRVCGVGPVTCVG
jgi:glycosidase/MoaA/NifB/PqqE/SkfB family radical SAM enzyme